MAAHHPQGEIFHKSREMIKLLNVHLNHFPKHEKYGLSLHIRQKAYEVYDILVECRKRHHNKTSLRRLDVAHEQLRMLTSLAFELGYYHYKDSRRGNSDSEAQRRYTAISIFINELGSMIGGWIRSTRDAA